jgi:hypothetical protein
MSAMIQDADRPPPTQTGPDAAQAAMPVNRMDENFLIEATLIGELLGIPPVDVPALMRSGDITSVCESGVDADQGTFRLNLFYRGRHARLRVDPAGQILQRSIIDFGDRPRASRSATSSPQMREQSPQSDLSSTSLPATQDEREKIA